MQLKNTLLLSVLTALAITASLQAELVTRCEILALDINAQPIADAEVVAFRNIYDFASGLESTKLLHRTRTDNTGRATLQITAEDAERAIVVIKKEPLAIGWDTLPYFFLPICQLSIILEEPAPITGKVISSDYKPIANALVQAVPKTSYLRRLDQRLIKSPKEWFTTTTNSKGLFRFDCFAPDVYTDFIVKAPNGRGLYRFTPHYGNSEGYESAHNNIRLVMPEEVSLKGTVIDAKNGKPISGLGVAVFPVPNKTETRTCRQQETTTDSDGKFAFPGVQAVPNWLKVFTHEQKTGKWLDRGIKIDSGKGKESSDITVEIKEGALAQFTVIDSVTKNPVKGASITLSPTVKDDNFIWWSRCQLTDAKGKATITAQPGECKVRIWCSGYAYNQVFDPIDVSIEKPVDIKIQLDPNPSVSGVVVDKSGNPVAGIWVEIMPGEGPTLTDAKGRFTATFELRDKKRFVMARDPKGNRACFVAVEGRTENVKVTLKDALTLSGKIVDQQGKGIAAARVSLYVLASHSGCPIGRELITDANGNWTIGAMPQVSDDFTYRISVDRGGFGRKNYNRIKVTADPANNAKLDDIILLPANLSISGRVIDSQGHPVAGLRISQNANNQPHRTATTDDFGEFTITRLCEGPVHLQAGIGKESFKPGFLKAKAGDTNVIITMGQED